MENKDLNTAAEEIIRNHEKGDLGSVIKPHSDDVELQKLKSKFGYTEMILENLPSKGRFYPMGTKIFFRAAEVDEIKEFSTLDESVPADLDEKLNNILLMCCKIECGNRRLSYKDILEEDRIFIILSIKELTFINGENKMILNHVCKTCQHENKFELRTQNLRFYSQDLTLEKYYSEEERCFNIKTKSGTFKMAPPKIGVMKAIIEYSREKEAKREKWDKSYMQIFSYINQDWRDLTDQVIFSKNVEFAGWSAIKFSTVLRLAEKMKVGVQKDMIQQCTNCSAEVAVPISFPGGIKSLFVISDIDSELL